MNNSTQARLIDLFKTLGVDVPLDAPQGIALASPTNGMALGRLANDTPEMVTAKIQRAAMAQKTWYASPRSRRVELLEAYAATLKVHRDLLAEIIHLEAGKTLKESLGEADASSDIIIKTIKDASLPELNGMLRRKERPPVGTVGLITSFNFPLVVAHWTIAPAMLAGNAVVWKPSEKTSLVPLAAKALFDRLSGSHADLLQILAGHHNVGRGLIGSEQVDMISATGSVAMGQAIKSILMQKKNNLVPPILELGGNNGVIISDKISAAHLQWSLNALLTSILGTAGQRCTDTRRLIIHEHIHDQAANLLKGAIEKFLKTAITADGIDSANEYGYGPLIDKDAFERFEKAKKEVMQQNGVVLFGKRLFADKYPDAYYVEPALALLPQQSTIMHAETFAPILFVTPYRGSIDEGMALLNAPANAGLVNGIYTQSQQEADRFAMLNAAGHGVINSAKGTGTPAFGMGFGGNRDSGFGEILNSADPLQAFTRMGRFSRIAQNKDVKMDAD